MDAAFEDQVRRRAYAIWIELGRGEGQADEHWIAAERDLLAKDGPAKAPRKPAVAKAASGGKLVSKVKAPKTGATKVTVSRKRGVDMGGAPA